MRRLRLVLPALLLATLIATIPARASSAPRYSTAGRWIVDGEGRRLLLRGLDVMGAEFTPTTTPLPYGPSDFAAMRAMGATVVRLPIAWSWVEPQRGRYDQAALQRAHDIVAWAGQAGLLVVLDMHQWHWSPCFGGNGMPEWATNPCPHTTPSPTSAAIEAVPEDAFWSSQDLQARFAEAWAAVAAAVGAPDNLLGYDLLNEPPLGTIPPVVFENTVLPRFYRAVAARLRQVDAGGLVFVEPALTHALHRFTMAELGIERAVYEPHLYGNSFNDASGHAGDFLGPGQFGPDLALGGQEAARIGAAYWPGEWGYLDDSTSLGWREVDYARDMLAAQDAAMVGSAYWTYWVPPGTPAGGTFPFTAAVRGVLTRPAPLAVAGDPHAFSTSEQSLTLSWVAAKGSTRVGLPGGWVPTVTVLRGPVSWRASGAWLDLSADPGTTVEVRVTP